MDDVLEFIFNPLTLIILIVGLLVFSIYASIQSDKAFALKVSQEYNNCIAAKETEYTCKAYIQSMEAKRSADEAQSSASMAAGMSAASMGYAAGRR